MKDIQIALFRMERIKYPDLNGFRPSQQYPEYIFNEISEEKNYVYDGVREIFHLLGYDKENYGKKTWNPLSELIHPGDNVLIKPNMVRERNFSGEGEECLYTNPSIIAAVIDYCLIALNGSGSIIVGDAPVQSCDFETLIRESGYINLIDFYADKGINIELKDFRGQKYIEKDLVSGRYELKKRECKVDLDENSEFTICDDNRKYRITDYDPRAMQRHHNGKEHEYYIASEVLNADVIINVPKPKSHRKAGITVSMKNMIGTVSRKECLPHHTSGSAEEGGDEYLKKNIFKKMQSAMIDCCMEFKQEEKNIRAGICAMFAKMCGGISKFDGDFYSEGSWYGNNTISRTISDVNKIIKYADKNGNICDESQRKIFIIADMVICGEKEGPLLPTPKKVGLIAAGENTVLFDEAICMLMGFEPKKIPTIQQAKGLKEKYNLGVKNEWQFVSNDQEYNRKSKKDINKRNSLNFIPSKGWLGHIELEG